MQSELINIYMQKKTISVDFNLIMNVNCDNIHSKLNEIYAFDWTYEVKVNENCVIVTLYIPGRILTGVAHITESSNIAESTACALAFAFTNGYYVEANNDISTEQPIKIIDIPQENVVIKEVEEETKVNTNPFGIRDEQIKFMNDFKSKNNIDTNEKFDYYVKTWSENTGNEITTKNELIKSGEKMVDQFIKWVSMIEKLNVSPISVSM